DLFCCGERSLWLRWRRAVSRWEWGAADAPAAPGDEGDPARLCGHHGFSTQKKKKSERVPSLTSRPGSLKQRTRSELDRRSGSVPGAAAAQPTSSTATSSSGRRRARRITRSF